MTTSLKKVKVKDEHMVIRTGKNKAVYTTASVAYGWVGAVMEVKSLLGVFLTFRDRPTDRPTYGPTDRPTE